MQLKAYAKINWSLDIVGQRADGYHLMDMLMQPVSLFDTITVEPADHLTLTVSGNPYIPPDEHHLALRVARALQKKTDGTHGAHIHVHKQIPAQAGLGGGSADAAAVLMALNTLWECHLPLPVLCNLALPLGADIPFCLTGGLQRVQGIGEHMRAVPCSPRFSLLLIKPCEGLSTRTVFENFVQSTEHPSLDLLEQALCEGDLNRLKTATFNVLEPVSLRLEPRIQQALRFLEESGACLARMSGSGSACFGVYQREDILLQAEACARQAFDFVAIAQTQAVSCEAF